MYSLVSPPRFGRNLKRFLRKHPDLRSVFQERLVVLQKNPADPGLRVHKLTGELKDCLAFSVTHDYRVVFRLEENAIVLLAIGTHDEVY